MGLMSTGDASLPWVDTRFPCTDSSKAKCFKATHPGRALALPGKRKASLPVVLSEAKAKSKDPSLRYRSGEHRFATVRPACRGFVLPPAFPGTNKEEKSGRETRPLRPVARAICPLSPVKHHV